MSNMVIAGDLFDPLAAEVVELDLLAGLLEEILVS